MALLDDVHHNLQFVILVQVYDLFSILSPILRLERSSVCLTTVDNIHLFKVITSSIEHKVNGFVS